MAVIDVQVHAYEANHPGRPWVGQLHGPASASGEEMVRPIGQQLGVTDVIATRMTIEDGRYSGKIEFYAAGPMKVQAARELAEQRGYDLSTCYAYSDSASDVPLLELVGHPTAVNPRIERRFLLTILPRLSHPAD